MSDYQDEWLKRIEDKLDRVGEQTSQIKPLQERFAEHATRDDELFYGNGAPGLLRDVDRLKQAHARINRYWPFILLIAAAGGSSVPDIIHAALAIWFK